MSGNRSDRVVRWLERGLATVGVTCLLWGGATSSSALVYQVEHGIPAEHRAYSLDAAQAEHGPNGEEIAVGTSTPIGQLEIPRLGLSAVVAEGDDENTLKVAVGHLPDTPFPWQDGNSALAGHRDSFFRALRRIHVGDDIRFATRHGTFRYRVTRHTVVDPDELWVLRPAPAAALTLITCYPFDYIGPAPRRFVVHAERIANSGDNLQANAVEGGRTR